MIRVFPRRTKYTPDDDLAFCGGPPLYPLPDCPVYVSCVFTWDIPEALKLYDAWAFAWRRKTHLVYLGGPAFGSPVDGPFTPGRFVKFGVTFTSRGCPKRCAFCSVRMREGKVRPLPVIIPGNIVADNNLLACPKKHIAKVFDMLATQQQVRFPGGLDLDYLTPWVVERLAALPSLRYFYVACDSDRDLDRLAKADGLLAGFSRSKRRCYVLVGFDGENQDAAARRCRAVYDLGFDPYAQLYRGMSSGSGRGPWRDLIAFWSQPAIYRTAIEGEQ
jgi:hypothetical protein